MVDDKINVTMLKNAFKEGATPNQENYAQLIDLAAVGSKALGATEADATNLKPGAGLKLAKGKLSVNPGKGLIIDKDNAVAVKVDNKTITATSSEGLAIAIDKSGGLDPTASGLSIKTGPGLTTGEAGLEIACGSNGGLSTQDGKLRVLLADNSGLCLDNNKLSIKLNTTTPNYIESTNEGLAITQDGVQVIGNKFKKISGEALVSAVKATKQGSTKISNNGDTLEGKISRELNTAYSHGYQKRREEKIVVSVTSPVPISVISENPVNLAKLAKAQLSDLGKTVYFTPGHNDKNLWDKIVSKNGLSSSGMLHLTCTAGGGIYVLALVVSYDTEGFPDILATTVKVNIDNPPDNLKSTIVMPKYEYEPGMPMKVTVMLKDSEVKPVSGYKGIIESKIQVPNCSVVSWSETLEKGSYAGVYTTANPGENLKITLNFGYPNGLRIESETFTIKEPKPTINNLHINNSGDVQVGETLEALFDAPADCTPSYQWQYKSLNGKWTNPEKNGDQSWGKGKKFTPSDDYGKERNPVRVTVTVTRNGETQSATSEPVTMIPIPVLKINNLHINKSGDVQVGETLEALFDAPADCTPSYQWQYKSSNGKWTNPEKNGDQSWGKGQKFTPSDDYGKERNPVRVTVTVTRNGVTQSATSEPVTMIPVLKINNLHINKSGDVQVGETLEALFDAPADCTPSYQWQYKSSNGEWKNPEKNGDQSWGKGQKFTPSDDYGKERNPVRVTVTVTRNGVTQSATSEPVTMIPKK